MINNNNNNNNSMPVSSDKLSHCGHLGSAQLVAEQRWLLVSSKVSKLTCEDDGGDGDGDGGDELGDQADLRPPAAPVDRCQA